MLPILESLNDQFGIKNKPESSSFLVDIFLRIHKNCLDAQFQGKNAVKNA